ncbi:MAG TPA: hypothetical protein VM510_17705 [Caulifigura sp.]|nr:hypothetical protein [Caulifigura sp.]
MNAPPERRLRMSLFADRNAQRWVVRDSEGRFWAMPVTATSWEERDPIEPSDDMTLEPVPVHYLVLVGLPA